VGGGERCLLYPRCDASKGRGTNLVEIEDKVKLAHVAKELVEELDEEVDGLKVKQLIVGHVLREPWASSSSAAEKADNTMGGGWG
jgi:acetyl-CoA acetyltransferase